MSDFKAVYYVVAVGILVFGFQNCSKVAFSGDPALDQASVTPSGTPDVPVVLPPPTPTPPATTTEEALKTLQPALAVRAIACVLCHAQIKANVITDFGYGTSRFMGGTADFVRDDNWFSNGASTWQSSHITGSVFVPNVPVTARAQEVLGTQYTNKPPLKLPIFMVTPYESQRTDHITAEESHVEMAFHVTPTAGADRVVGKSQVKIRAPSISEIQALAPKLWANQASVSGAFRVGTVAATAQPIQLTQRGPNGNTFLQNDENTVLECANSDIVIRGTLLLRKLKVNAAGGCRLYVSGTVFIEQGITYTGGGLQNLQISSASAVIMGINIAGLNKRLLQERRGLELVARDYAPLADQILSEANAIGTLEDAIADYPSDARGTYDYNGLLLNAPIVQSRYLGTVRGTIISEAILFALGQFEFQFDPVFTKVNVLPLLKDSVLEVK